MGALYNLFNVFNFATVAPMKNSNSHIPTGTISVSVANYCNLWSGFSSWYQFNRSVLAIIDLSKSRLKQVSCTVPL